MKNIPLRKRIILAAVIIVAVAIFLIVFFNRAYTSENELDTEISGIEQGYMYARGVIDSLNKDTELSTYSVIYPVAELADDPLPYYYDFNFAVLEPGGELGEDGYLVHIDLLNNKVNIFETDILYIEALDSPVQLPEIEEFLNVIKDKIGSDIYEEFHEKNSEAVVQLYKHAFIEHVYPPCDWYDLSVYNEYNINDLNWIKGIYDSQESLFSSTIDVKGKQAFEND